MNIFLLIMYNPIILWFLPTLIWIFYYQKNHLIKKNKEVLVIQLKQIYFHIQTTELLCLSLGMTSCLDVL